MMGSGTGQVGEEDDDPQLRPTWERTEDEPMPISDAARRHRGGTSGWLEGGGGRLVAKAWLCVAQAHSGRRTPVRGRPSRQCERSACIAAKCSITFSPDIR
jgi:hypothetical protein